MKKFSIEKIVLWLKNGKQRVLKFEPDKVNVITGESNTGKSAILEIVDYCLFASSPQISDSIINENVEWYGLKFSINDKTYTIARKCFTKVVSNEYYFSSIGNIPKEFPVSNNTESALKPIIETEFSINSTTKFTYGSNQLKLGSKISLRYFLMFNTISQDIITESRDIYFDKQDNSRYKEALPRIFDIATGIESVENILFKERKEQLEKKLILLENKSSKIDSHRSIFREEQDEILRTAREFDLINSSANDQAINELKQVVSNKKFNSGYDSSERDELERGRNLVKRKINNLKKLKSEYNIYKKNLKTIQDSLAPIDYLKNKVEVRTDYFEYIMVTLEKELKEIKNINKKVTPIDKQVDDEILALNIQLDYINLKLETLPKKISITESDEQKLIFIGRVAEKFDLYSNPNDSPNKYQEQIDTLEEEIAQIPIVDTEKSRLLTIGLIEEVVLNYMQNYGEVLGNYANYYPLFDYKEKSLKLRKPRSTKIENKIGSSSNHMFLHLFFSLAIHEVIFINKAPYVPPFLIIDQPSRPYYGRDNSARKIVDNISSDDSKIRQAFVLLNEYIMNRLENSGHFQMIVFEHIEPDSFEDLDYIHLVEEFKDGNALIPDNFLID